MKKSQRKHMLYLSFPTFYTFVKLGEYSLWLFCLFLPFIAKIKKKNLIENNVIRNFLGSI